MKKLKKVLLIDDSKASNSRNERLLEEMNLFESIFKYSDSKEALQAVKTEDTLPDIIFLDLQMPEMDGFAFLDQYIELDSVRKVDFTPIIVIVSAHLDFENFDKVKRFKSYGVLEHIKKPMDKEDVLSLLDEHIEGFEV